MQGLMVAVATTGSEMPTQANARLIAAAPELVDALKIARDYMCNAIGTDCAQDLEELFRDLRKVDAALAKAGAV